MKNGLEVETPSAIHRVTAFAECYQIAEFIRFAPIGEVTEAANVVNLKALFLRGFATATALPAVALSGLTRLLAPVRTIIRLISTLPRWMVRGIIAQPIIPAGRGAKAARTWSGPTSGNLVRPLALQAGFIYGAEPKRIVFTPASRRQFHSAQLVAGLLQHWAVTAPTSGKSQIAGVTPFAPAAMYHGRGIEPPKGFTALSTGALRRFGTTAIRACLRAVTANEARWPSLKNLATQPARIFHNLSITC